MKNTEAILIVLGDSSKYDIIVIQESVYNKETGRLYCPACSRYSLIYRRKGRAVLYIHKYYDITI